LAALTIASTSRVVMSASITLMAAMSASAKGVRNGHAAESTNL
jgi:hypothetical protein